MLISLLCNNMAGIDVTIQQMKMAHPVTKYRDQVTKYRDNTGLIFHNSPHELGKSGIKYKYIYKKT